MDIKTHIKTLLQEAELYKTQGLIVEAKLRYQAAQKIIQSGKQVKNKQQLLTGIASKIRTLEEDEDRLKNASATPEVSSRVQDLIKQLFSFSQDKNENTAALEGALTLAKFGQYERALIEFEKLMQVESLRVIAAKNCLRCHLALSSADEAIAQFMKWSADKLFSAKQIEKIRIFLENILSKKGIKTSLGTQTASLSAAPAPTAVSTPATEPAAVAEMVLDVQSLGITLDPDGPQKSTPESKIAQAPAQDEEYIDISSIEMSMADGGRFEFEVSFQTGNMISLIIATEHKSFLDTLEVGLKLNDVQFYSPIAIFSGNATVTAKTQIQSGPKQGDYSLDLKVESK